MSKRKPRQNILSIYFDLIDYPAVVKTIHRWRQRGERSYVSITNPHSVLMCQRNEAMKKATATAALTLPDGVGIIWAARILGYEHHGRVTGPMLLLNLCDWGRKPGFRHFFYGGSEGVADRLAARMKERFPGIEVAGTYCPPFRTLSQAEDSEVISQINATRPDILWVGLGAPKQEIWMLEHLGKVRAAAMIGVGAAFDFHSGNIPWSPCWLRNWGFEWAWRLALNPKRMWKRNLDSPIFLAKVLAQKFKRMLGKDVPQNPLSIPQTRSLASHHRKNQTNPNLTDI